MKYIEFSIEELEDRSKELAEIISKEFYPDVVVFVAKGSFLIGKEISKYFNVPLVECFAIRKGNHIKQLLSPILRILPWKLKTFLRQRELVSNFHSYNKDRNVFILYQEEILKRSKRILVVDDSIDTGYTIKEVVSYLKTISKENIKVAALNYFVQSLNVYKIDYSLYTDCIMVGPWSKDSKYYDEFMNRYREEKSIGGI